jgi:hypothetical protein
MSHPPKKRDISGPLVVGSFLGICFLVALGSVLLTVYGRDTAPILEEPPPEIGHELIPRR